MAGYDRELIQEIVDRVSLKDVVQEYVTLQKSGREYKGLCPFHQEKTPSFHVIENKNFFYCFGCQAGGDAVKFLQLAAGLTRGDAVRRLAQKAGMELPQEGPADPRAEAAEKKRADLLHANQVALEVFRANLNGPDGDGARAYLEERSISADLVERYGLGYGGSRKGHLVRELEKRKVSPRQAEEAGLLSRSKFGGSGWYERFHGRLLFPVYNLDGAVTAFSGRLVPPMEDGPKYLNSPETPVFQKSEMVFGLLQARATIRKQKRSVMVEGNFDVLAMAAAGLENVVAPLGTSLTRSQVHRLKRFAADTVLVFDGDEAGRKASRKAVGLLVEAEMEGHVALMPPGEDPDSLLRTSGKASMEKMLSSAKPMIRYLVESLVEVHGRSPHGIRKVIEEAKGVFSLDRDPIRFGLYREELGRILGIDVRELKRLLRDPGTTREESKDSEPCPAAEKTLLELMMLFPSLIKRFLQEGDPNWVTQAEARDVLGDLVTGSRGGEEDPAEAIVSGADSGGPLRASLIEVFKRPETYDEDQVDGTFTEALAEVERLALSRQRRELEQRLLAAEDDGQRDDVDHIAAEISGLNRRMRGLEREVVRQKTGQKENNLAGVQAITDTRGTHGIAEVAE